MSEFTTHVRASTGQSRFAVVETGTGIDVWARLGAPGAVASALAEWLNVAAADLSAREVRAMLAPVSDLPAVPDVEERAS